MTNQNVSILVVDDEPPIRKLLRVGLSTQGYAVSEAPNARVAIELMQSQTPDLILLDLGLPGMTGLELLGKWRGDGLDIPVVILSSRTDEAGIVKALESGADDFICKPFGPRETIARLHAVLRRRRPAAMPGTLQVAGLRLDPHTLSVTAGDRQLNLGRVEFRLLNYLMHHPGRVHSRAQLLDQVWGSHVYLDERTVDAHVGRLRHALQPSGLHDAIQTVRGSGYRFHAEMPAPC